MGFLEDRKKKKEEKERISQEKFSAEMESEASREVFDSCEGCTNQDITFCTDCNADNGYKWHTT